MNTDISIRLPSETVVDYYKRRSLVLGDRNKRLRELLVALVGEVGSLDKDQGTHALDEAYEAAKSYLSNAPTTRATN